MSKLQEFLDLGNYYASNGGYLEKRLPNIWMILRKCRI